MMTTYPGSLDDAHELIQFVRRETTHLRSLRRLIVSPEKTVVFDVNGDGMEFPGLTYGSQTLEALLEELGVVFNPQVLHRADATPNGVKEFSLSARFPWGSERVM